MRTRANRSDRAFTLLEMLVVVGIIALLIAILMPALTAARESSNSVQCLSNLRQLALAAHIYVNENDGFFPLASYNAADAGFFYGYNWDFTLLRSKTTGERTTEPGLLWNGRTDARIQQCPSFDGRSNTLMDPYTGYNYNYSYIGKGQVGSVTVPPAKVSQVRSPAATALFGDGQWSSGANKFMRSPEASPFDSFGGQNSGTQGYRHRGQTNIAFVDGHAEPLRKCFGDGVARGTGFISIDNSLYDLD